MSATAKKGCATRKLRTQFFGRAARFEVALPVGKTNDAVSVRDVQELRIVTGRIKRDPEWFVQIALRKYFGDVRFADVLCAAQHFDSIGAALSDEDVSIRRGE